jgi:hypothetical protein
VFTDVVWKETKFSGQNYRYEGTFGKGKDHTTQAMRLFCRAGRGGGCAWRNEGGSTGDVQPSQVGR